ncbi:tRNA threonylcarbamoyladenosine biosynthesis protein RimN [Eikenella longinqua]|uniref:Threonylcarbamoyl-AMP synthase n=1 Tax=Eikenella longinqua TaxID=1795827 RepID=A0A1A9RWX8_9NEIS|nr:L-threonylcarbamoyladenylate synthase [Eikenella longinqua]OAM27591.1 tRNA threonylcarbamoyladenosine biosynthesis protein RimN [Eikenella longinqua]
MFPRILSASAARRLQAHLRRGGLVAYPTESSYGLGCLPTSPHALRRLMQLKQRPQHKGLIVIGSSLPQLLPLLGRLPENQKQLAENTWPAPVTLLFRAAPRIPAILRGRHRSKLAVRIPAHDGARRLCAALGTPLVSTSCNKSGRRALCQQREVQRCFGRKVWVLPGRCGGAKQPSRIIDAETGKRLR